MRSASSRDSSTTSCQVIFGGATAHLETCDECTALRVAVEVLRGGGHECVLSEAVPVGPREGLSLFRCGELTGGFTLGPDALSLEAATDDVYRRLFAATTGLHLYRIWNYVPHINGAEAGLENYRRFCRARSLAFEARFGPNFQRTLPASSAVGASAGPLAVAFVAGPTPCRHFESPVQMPAFEYPPEHGPRPPSFSRATVADCDGVRHVFISGTAAIRGHVTVAPGTLDRQMECTLENLRRIGEEAGIGPSLGDDAAWRRRFKIYLRHPEDLEGAIPRLEASLIFRPDDEVIFLQAEICRAELVVEIEAAFERRLRDAAE